MLRLALSCIALPLVTVPALADFPYEELWAERNAAYKEAGYCFKTAKAIAAFGNAGCQYDDVAELPLSARDRAKIADVQRQERANGCQR